MREFFKRLPQYWRSLLAVVLSSLLPYFWGLLRDTVVGQGIAAVWGGLGGPMTLSEAMSSLQTHPVIAAVLALGVWLAISAFRAERHVKRVSEAGARVESTRDAPTVQIFRHKEARKHNDAVFHRIHELFEQAGWRVEGGNTDLPQHENGIRIAGGAGYEREAAAWGLNALGLDWIPDQRTNPPDVLQVIVGRYAEKTKTDAPRPIRVLERHYLALASLKEHVGRMKRLEAAGGEVSAGAYIDTGLALEKMRKELVNLSPEILTTSEAFDFREKPPEENGLAGLSEQRVPREIDHLMTTILRHWGRRGEAVGITPLKFKETPIVKLTDS
jgi:hypothetical protein